jgi:electron transfer flavoprotein beta subunit
MGAKKKPQETVSLGELGVDAAHVGEAGSRTEVYALAEPPPRGESLKIDDDGTAADKILEFLAGRKAL